MNTHARNPRYKLVMVSVRCGWELRTTFMMLPVDGDGKVRAPMNVIDHIPVGKTFQWWG
jgi:hypothetical protein